MMDPTLHRQEPLLREVPGLEVGGADQGDPDPSEKLWEARRWTGAQPLFCLAVINTSLSSASTRLKLITPASKLKKKNYKQSHGDKSSAHSLCSSCQREVTVYSQLGLGRSGLCV